MSSCTYDQNKCSLIQLRRRLEVYSAALVEWQQALADADREIRDLTPSAAIEAAAHIEGIQQSHDEYETLKRQVEAGWELYRQLSENPGVATINTSAFAPLPLPTSLQ
ncbi:MAG: hypothetical protein ACR2PI_26090 [Hyphomicrobiaceae bacterium]